MKNKIINFLFKKRFKVLKNKKGFSLLEVLIAVGIIAIISAIAVPQYQNTQRDAAKVAGETSINNIEKAFMHCTALKDFDKCDELGASELNVHCPDCSSEKDTTNKKFCAHISKSAGGKTFNACISINNGTVTKTFGGTLLDQVDVCKKTDTSVTPNVQTIISPVKTCKQSSECEPSPIPANTTYQCEAGGDGLCKSGSPECT